jgi:hypothetical protein
MEKVERKKWEMPVYLNSSVVKVNLSKPYA